ncbi:MAG: hypothetical protein Q8N26_38185 [Myxococcales bacterium]|nr:hypothetical protein [Myxococcales bacterium]
MAEDTETPRGGERPKVANREERQAFWTAILRDDGRPMDERLRASELLARSEADFITRVESKGMTLEQLIIEAARPKS